MDSRGQGYDRRICLRAKIGAFYIGIEKLSQFPVPKSTPNTQRRNINGTTPGKGIGLDLESPVESGGGEKADRSVVGAGVVPG